MRHRLNKGKKLGMTGPHRRSTFANLATALITHEQVRTTLPKAKELKRVADKLISIAKNGTKGGLKKGEELANRRRALAKLGDEEAVRKMWQVLAPRYEKRNGGYTRVLKMGVRYGDCAPMAVIEFVNRDKDARGKEDKARHLAQKKEQEANQKDTAPKAESKESKKQTSQEAKESKTASKKEPTKKT